MALLGYFASFFAHPIYNIVALCPSLLSLGKPTYNKHLRSRSLWCITHFMNVSYESMNHTVYDANVTQHTHVRPVILGVEVTTTVRGRKRSAMHASMKNRPRRDHPQKTRKHFVSVGCGARVCPLRFSEKIGSEIVSKRVFFLLILRLLLVGYLFLFFLWGIPPLQK